MSDRFKDDMKRYVRMEKAGLFVIETTEEYILRQRAMCSKEEVDNWPDIAPFGTYADVKPAEGNNSQETQQTRF